MNKLDFFKNLIGLSTGLMLVIFLLPYIPLFKGHQLFFWMNLGFFLLFTIGVYYLAEKAAYSTNLHTFSSVILGVIFMKMVFIIIIVLIYKKTMNPGSPWFLVPFFLIYVVFTIFEIYFMTKLARIKPPKSEKSEVQSSSK
ncbi:MAG: hypothetical protein ACI8P3_004005 [Saprospiraceae bacterium]|jgi:hypothetical protein